MDALRLEGCRLDAVKAGPKYLFLDLYPRCNLLCAFCNGQKPASPATAPFLRYDALARVIDEAAELRVEEVLLTGDGEPTLHPDFARIIARLRSAPVSIGMTTNGAFAERLQPSVAAVHYLNINFSAPDEALYRRVQNPAGPSLYGRVVRNIRMLARRARTRSREGKLTLVYIVNALNYKAVLGALAFARGAGVPAVKFRRMEPTPDNKKIELSQSQRRELLDIIARAPAGDPVEHNLPDLRRQFAPPGRRLALMKACFTGYFNASVGIDGTVVACCANAALRMGNISEATLRRIWESSAARRVRQAGKYGFSPSRPPFGPACAYCYWAVENAALARRTFASASAAAAGS